jgi:uncharacterized protein YkwD
LRSLLALFAALFLLVTLTLGNAIRPAEARERGFEGRVIHVLNAVRAHHGLPRLVACGRLNLAARFHSADLAQRGLLAHESSDGTPMDLRVRRFVPTANAVGETIAAVRSRVDAADTVVRLWLSSPAHRAIMLSRSFRRIGIGLRGGWLGSARAFLVTADYASR